MVNAIMASSNQPVYADLVNMYNAKYDRIEQFGDGGIRDYLPIQAAIDLGDTAIDITMETRGPDHIAELLSALAASDYAHERIL